MRDLRPTGRWGWIDAVVPETIAALAAAAVVVFLAALLPDAQALDTLACSRFYLAQGCSP
jgi:hypothetical protein